MKTPLSFLCLLFLFIAGICFAQPHPGHFAGFNPGPWYGYWQGTMGGGTHRFRVAFDLEPVERGAYHNIDDGIEFETMALKRKGETLQGFTTGGGILTLPAAWGREPLTGTFTQGPGKDAEQSLVGENETYPVTLWRGEDDLFPRFGADGKVQTNYSYTPPKKISDGWATGDLREARADVSILEDSVRDILKQRYPLIHSLLVVKDGKLVLDEYFYGYGPEDPHPVQSVTKSIFSLLFGIGVDQGLFRPDQKLFDFFPSYRQRPDWDSRKDQVTLKTLLTMTSGLGCDDFKDSTACSWDMVHSADWGEFALSLPLNYTPGSHYAYCGACLSPLAAILEKQSGLPVDRFAQKYLFEPLGIETPVWWEGPRGFHAPAFGLSLRPRDLAKIGLLVLGHGKWKGTQVVSEKWLVESQTPQVSPSNSKTRYGELWWVRDMPWKGKTLRVLDARGVGGQDLFIVPELQLVCVLTGGNYKDSALSANSLKIFQDYVLTAF